MYKHTVSASLLEMFPQQILPGQSEYTGKCSGKIPIVNMYWYVILVYTFLYHDIHTSKSYLVSSIYYPNTLWIFQILSRCICMRSSPIGSCQPNPNVTCRHQEKSVNSSPETVLTSIYIIHPKFMMVTLPSLKQITDFDTPATPQGSCHAWPSKCARVGPHSWVGFSDLKENHLEQKWIIWAHDYHVGKTIMVINGD